MDDVEHISDEQLVVGMAAFLIERHGERTIEMVERRIEELTDGEDELALALYRGVAIELRRIEPSSARH